MLPFIVLLLLKVNHAMFFELRWLCIDWILVSPGRNQASKAATWWWGPTWCSLRMLSLPQCEGGDEWFFVLEAGTGWSFLCAAAATMMLTCCCSPPTATAMLGCCWLTAPLFLHANQLVVCEVSHPYSSRFEGQRLWPVGVHTTIYLDEKQAP